MEFEAWNEQLVEQGTKVIRYRLILLEQVQEFISAAHYEISGANEHLELAYLGFGGEALNFSGEAELKKRFHQEIQAVRPLERERRITLAGPQRDDLRLRLGQKMDLRNYGSQGQQRTAALALKLGLVEKIKATRGQYPIMLLDDVMAEFDDDRKNIY